MSPEDLQQIAALIAASEQRIVAAIRTEIAAVEAGVRAEIAAAEVRVRAEIVAAEARVRTEIAAAEARAQEFARDIETNLLRAFHGHAKGQTARLHSAEVIPPTSPCA